MIGEEDILMRKMILDMQRKLIVRRSQQREERVDYVKVFLDNVSEEGLEMYNKALEQYPTIAPKVAEALGRLIAHGKIDSPLDAETVYRVFQELGYPIRLETKIVYKKKGKVKSIGELLKEEG